MEAGAESTTRTGVEALCLSGVEVGGVALLVEVAALAAEVVVVAAEVAQCGGAQAEAQAEVEEVEEAMLQGFLHLSAVVDVALH